MSLKPVDNTELSISDFPPPLQKLAEYVLKDPMVMNQKPLTEICKDLELNYGTVTNEIYAYNKKNKLFWDVVRREVKKGMGSRLLIVENGLFAKSQNSELAVDTKASELILKQAGEIQSGNKTDITVNQQNNYLTMNTIEALPIADTTEEDNTIPAQYVVVEGSDNSDNTEEQS